MKKRTKVMLISTVSAIVTASLVGTSFFITFRDKPVTALNTYVLKFTNGENLDSKNEYINDMISRTRKTLDMYQKYYEETYGEKFPGLTFNYVNLNASQSEGEKNFFVLLDRTLKAIDHRLGFNNIARTPSSVQEGFYQKNTELLSFYWSPDFNAITTWLTYVFSDQFPIANQWNNLYSLLENPTESWQTKLKNVLQSKDLYHSPIDILNYSLNGKDTSEYYTTLANTIGTWVVNNSSLKVIPNHSPDNEDGLLDTAQDPGDGIKLVNWLTSQILNIPFVEDGPQSSNPFLIREGYFNPTNPNADNNFRDWYYNKSVFNGNAQFRYWNKADPFEVNKTPFNPAFSNASSSSFFNSAWVGLTSWTTTSNYENIRDPEQPIEPSNTFLVSSGSKTPMSELLNGYDEADNILIFKIRSIPWVNYTGEQINDDKGRPAYLSPEDFKASIIAFIRSNQISLNSNGYFLDLISLDINKILNDPKNSERNLSPNDEKEFVLHFKKKPDLSMNSVLDILQKQYFCAIPAFKQSVKNIIDYNTFRSLLPGATEDKSSPNKYIDGEYDLKVDSSAINFDKFYGSGNPVLSGNWKDYAFASPYYISSIDQQQIVFNLNNSYFDSFTQSELELDEYASFRKEQVVKPNDINNNKNENVISKIPKVILKYAGSYSEILTFEQFKNNELDLSELSSAKLLEAKKEFPQDYRSVVISKLNKSNLVSFNLQVFSKDQNGVILDNNEKPILSSDGKSVGYKMDQFGNYVFHNGAHPKIKSKVSKAYYDLIVRDFYTPLTAYNPKDGIYAASATIRETIANCINWVALKSVVFPGITKSIEYSFLPYGVYDIGDQKYNKKYWWYAAYKPYMVDKLNAELDKNNYLLRKSGMIIWTYNELLNNSIKKGGN